MNFQLSGQTWLFLAVLKISATLLKYPIFDGCFFMFSWAKKVQNQSFCTLYCPRYNIDNYYKCEKVLFCFEMHYFGFEIYWIRSKQAKHLQSILDEKECHPCFLQYLIHIFAPSSCDRSSDLAECSAVTRPLSQRDRWASWVTDALFQGIAGLTAVLSVFPFLNFTFADFERQDYFLIPV